MFDLTFTCPVGHYLPPLLCGACVSTVPGQDQMARGVNRIIGRLLAYSAAIGAIVIHYLNPISVRMRLRQCVTYCSAVWDSRYDAIRWRRCPANAEDGMLRPTKTPSTAPLIVCLMNMCRNTWHVGIGRAKKPGHCHGYQW
jgi:hypothetical protein